MGWQDWAPDFVGTLVVETPVYLLALRSAFGTRGALLASLALNLATQPLAWSAILRSHGSVRVFIVVELTVAIVEALLVLAAARAGLARRPLRIVEALAASLAANGFSAALGLLL
jgi:hypothetical protein